MLESELGQKIRLVAYPFGQPDAVSETTQQATRDAGYAYGLTTQSGSNSCTTNPTGAHRIMLDPAAGFVATAWGRVRNKLRPTPAPVAVPSSLGS